MAWILGLITPVWVFILEFILINRRAMQRKMNWIQAHAWYVSLSWIHLGFECLGIYWYGHSLVMTTNWVMLSIQVAMFFTAWVSALITIISALVIRYNKLELVEKTAK